MWEELGVDVGATKCRRCSHLLSYHYQDITGMVRCRLMYFGSMLGNYMGDCDCTTSMEDHAHVMPQTEGPVSPPPPAPGE